MYTRSLAPSKLLAALVAVFALATGSAHAANGKLVKQLEDYAHKNNFPIKKVKAPGSGAMRLFVPVLPGTYADFGARMSEKNGGIAMRAVAPEKDDYGHISVGFEPGSTYLWGQPRNDLTQYWNVHEKGGYLFGVELDDHEIKHMKQHSGTIGAGGGCMLWLGSAEIAPGKLFMHSLGMARSKGAGNAIRQKLLRVANDRLQVAGVMVNTVEEFNAMTEAQLLGPAHPNGDAEARHEY